MAYYGCAPGWVPDTVEAGHEGGKSVELQIAEERRRYAAETAPTAEPAVDLGAEPAVTVKTTIIPPGKR